MVTAGIVIFPDAVPNAINALIPQQKDCSILRTIVTTDIPVPVYELWSDSLDIPDMLFLLKHVIDNTFRHGPQAFDIALIEHARIHRTVSGFDSLRQAQIVVHGEMEI